MAKSNRAYREKYIEVTPRELAAERLKQGLSRAESLYGRLQDEQKRALQDALARSPWDVRASYERRLRRQQALMQSLRALQDASPELVRSRMKDWVALSIDGADGADGREGMRAPDTGEQIPSQQHGPSDPSF